jgi:hypothetical protein
LFSVNKGSLSSSKTFSESYFKVALIFIISVLNAFI